MRTTVHWATRPTTYSPGRWATRWATRWLAVSILALALAPGLAWAAPAPPVAPPMTPDNAQQAGFLRGFFATLCRFSHEAPDDPIVFPGQAGKSHLHTFFGNTTTSAASSYDSLRAGPTTCRTEQD